MPCSGYWLSGTFMLQDTIVDVITMIWSSDDVHDAIGPVALILVFTSMRKFWFWNVHVGPVTPGTAFGDQTETHLATWCCLDVTTSTAQAVAESRLGSDYR